MLLEESQKGFAHFGKAEWLFCCWFAYERVESTFVAACFAAGFHRWVLSPEVLSALGAKLACKAFLLEEG
jgi:hypothetical protein